MCAQTLSQALRCITDLLNQTLSGTRSIVLTPLTHLLTNPLINAPTHHPHPSLSSTHSGLAQLRALPV